MKYFNEELVVTNVAEVLKMPPDIVGDARHENRTYHGLVLNRDAVTVYRFDTGQTLKVGRNCFVYLPQGSYYTAEVEEKGTIFAANIEIANFQTSEPFCVKLRQQKSERDFEILNSLFLKKEKGSMLLCKSTVYTMLFDVMRESDAEYFDERALGRLDPALEYISDNFCEKIKIADLAKMCSVSEVYFRRLFAAKFGVPPVTYINTVRLSYAKLQLLGGKSPLSKIAAEAGFSDTTSFCRVFKAQTGFSPMKYKQNADI